MNNLSSLNTADSLKDTHNYEGREIKFNRKKNFFNFDSTVVDTTENASDPTLKEMMNRSQNFQMKIDKRWENI